MISLGMFTWFYSSIVAKAMEINIYHAINFP